MGYDPYPVVRKRLTEPASGTVPDTTAVSEHRIPIQEWSGTRPETEPGNGAKILLQE
jgi:hypothetical protein